MALKSVDDWEQLGEYLDLPPTKIRVIRADFVHKGLNRQRSEMIDQWLKHDIGPTWEKLCAALELMGEKRLAHEICQATR